MKSIFKYLAVVDIFIAVAACLFVTLLLAVTTGKTIAQSFVTSALGCSSYLIFTGVFKLVRSNISKRNSG